MQSSQSKATRKYEAKIGMISKSYKLKREIVEQFADACKNAGVSQSSQLTDMMQEFISNIQKR